MHHESMLTNVGFKGEINGMSMPIGVYSLMYVQGSKLMKRAPYGTKLHSGSSSNQRVVIK